MEIDLLVHIDNDLDPNQKIGLEEELGSARGVVEAKFCSGKEHLLFVKYRVGLTTPGALVRQLGEGGVRARLIGL